MRRESSRGSLRRARFAGYGRTPSTRSSHSSEQVEPHPAPCSAAFSGTVPEELCWPAATLAAPFIRRLDECGGGERATKARLVQSPSKQQLVHVLQLAQRERCRQQSECDRIQVQPIADCVHGLLQHLILPLGERRELAQEKPLELVTLHRRLAHRNEGDVDDREIGVARMGTFAESADLSAPDGCGARASPDRMLCKIFEGLAIPRCTPRKYPAHRLLSTFGAPLEQHRELIVAWSECDYVNGVMLTLSPGLSGHAAY